MHSPETKRRPEGLAGSEARPGAFFLSLLVLMGAMGWTPRASCEPPSERSFFTPLLVGGPGGVEAVLVRKKVEGPAFLLVRGPGGVSLKRPAGKGTILRLPLPVPRGPGPFSYRFTWEGGKTPWYSFRPLPGREAKSVRLAAYGDSRSNPKVHRLLAGLMAAGKPDLVLNTGDLVGAGPVWSQWERSFLEPLASLASHVPIYTVAGNHEGEAPSYYHLCTRSGPKRAWWSADIGPVHLVGLDSNIALGPGSPQREWLEKDLREAAGKPSWKILVLHHPFFTACPGRKPLSRVRDLLPLLLTRGVSLVLEGHDHHYMRTYPVVQDLKKKTAQGLVCVTTGGGGAPLYPMMKMPFAAKEVQEWHYLSIDAGPDRLAGEALDWKGRPIDRWEMTRKAGMPGPRYWVGSEALAQAGRAMLDRLGPLLPGKGFSREVALCFPLPGSPAPPPGMKLLLVGGAVPWHLDCPGPPAPGKPWKCRLRFDGTQILRGRPWPRLTLDLGVPGIAGRLRPLGAVPLWKPRAPWPLQHGGGKAPGAVPLVDRQGKVRAQGRLSAWRRGKSLRIEFYSPLGKRKTSKPRGGRLAQWAKGTRAECLALHLCGPGGKSLQSFQVTRSYRRFHTGRGGNSLSPGKGWKVQVLPGWQGKGWGASWEVSLGERGLPLPGAGLRFQVSHFLVAKGVVVSSAPLRSDLTPWPRTMQILGGRKPQ